MKIAAPLVRSGQQLKNRTEGNLSDETVPNADTNAKRAQCLALLRDVTAQRDKLLAEYEAMALQVDESVREIDEDILQIRQYADKAEANERRAEEATARANELARQLEDERRNSATVAQEFARFRLAAEQRQAAAERALALQPPPDETPPAMLWRAITLIACDAVAWTRAKIPPGSPLLPWFDRAIDVATKAGRLAWQCANAFVVWATPRVIDLWKWAKSEIAKRANKG